MKSKIIYFTLRAVDGSSVLYINDNGRAMFTCEFGLPENFKKGLGLNFMYENKNGRVEYKDMKLKKIKV